MKGSGLMRKIGTHATISTLPGLAGTQPDDTSTGYDIDVRNVASRQRCVSRRLCTYNGSRVQIKSARAP